MQMRAFAKGLAVVAFVGLSSVAHVAPSSAEQGPSLSPAPSPPSASDVPMAEHPVRVVDYTLRATLDPATHSVHGEGTITWRNGSSSDVSELWMHLYLNAFKNQSSVFMRAPVGGFRGTTLPKEWGTIDVRSLTWIDSEKRHDLWKSVELRRKDDEDETDARIALPRPVHAGETIQLDVVWDDKLPTVVERTGYDGSFHMIAQWFPKIAKLERDGHFAHFPFHHLGEFYADYGRYDVTLDVPQNFVIGATGPATEARTEGGRRIERHVQDDVHDFAWTAWDKFITRSETIDGVACTILYPKGYDDHAERELATMRFALPHYGARYGKYPYAVLTLVHPPASAPEAGGMEYPTLITTGGSAYIPRGVYLPELVTIHEFGHQYFYGLLASHETNWPFLDEGLNSYAEAEAMAAWKGAGSAVDFLGLRIGDADAHAERARDVVHDNRIAQPAYAFVNGNAYGGLIYSRTATIFETLRRVYGDTRMQRAMGAYARRFRFQHPVPNDLLETFRRELDSDAGEFLRASLFDKAWIDFEVQSVSSRVVRASAGLFDVGGKRERVPPDRESAGNFAGSVLVVKHGTLRIPVEIELIAEDGTRARVPWDVATDSIRVPYAGTSPLRAAIVDPDRKVVLDQDPTNNFATAPGRSTTGAPRTLERATYWTQLAIGAIAP